MGRRQLCFVLTLLAGVFSLSSTTIILWMMAFVFGSLFGTLSPFLLFFAWFGVASAIAGIILLVAAVRIRRATGEALARAAWWAIAGGVAAAIGGNMIAATLGIVAGALVLSDTPPAPAAPA